MVQPFKKKFFLKRVKIKKFGGQMINENQSRVISPTEINRGYLKGNMVESRASAA